MKKNKIVYHFRVSHHPVGRQEPQGARGHWFTPSKTKKYYNLIITTFLSLYPKLNDTTHKWKLRIEVYIYGKQYADCSNVQKAVEDSLQGFLWHNDKSIWDVHTVRHEIKTKKRDEHIFIFAEPMGEL